MMEDAIALLPEKHTWRDVLAKVEEIGVGRGFHATDHTEKLVKWFDGKADQETTFHKFRERLTRIRKKNAQA